MMSSLSATAQAAKDQLTQLLAGWTQTERLYRLEGAGPIDELMAEGFVDVDEVSRGFSLRLYALSLNARIDTQALLGQPLRLITRLSDGSDSSRSGLITGVRRLGCNGFARYELVLQPWTQLLTQTRHSRAWKDKSTLQILDDVFANPEFSRGAAWRWGESDAGGNVEDIAGFVAQGPNAGVRSYCAQYRESDLHFMQRLLAEEGLGWRIEEAEDAPAHHRLVIYLNSGAWPENLSSRSSLGGQGIRFHRAGAVEAQDAIQAFGGVRRLQPLQSAVLQWDYQLGRAVAVEVPTRQTQGPAVAPLASWLAQYRHGHAADNDAPLTSSQLQHRAVCAQEAHECRSKTWLGVSSVRSLQAGQRFGLTQSTLDVLSALGQDAEREFGVLKVQSLGINNLPVAADAHIAKTLGGVALNRQRPLCQDDPALDAIAQDEELLEKVMATGYVNRFEAIRRSIPWRPLHLPKPTALGHQTAVVVGPTGSIVPSGADELYTDALGRIKVQFHWQSAPHADPRDDNRSSHWVRVAQSWAGAGLGTQFIPRIGQEVIVQFLNGDIDRPVVTGALYNGQGEAGLKPTPGGKAATADLSPYANSSDHRPSAQGNLMGQNAGGHSPAWHGGAPGPATTGSNGQNNPAALSGVKSKEFGGAGYNQLVFDDTPGQLRVQLATTQHATQLNLGHLVHQADNHRGTFRGTGFELRTDAYGAIRAAQGVLLTSYGLSSGLPAGDNAAGMALLKQALTLADTFSSAAKTHQTTALASSAGTVKAGQSILSPKASPMKALLQTASGMVSAQALGSALGDAANTNTTANDGKLPHTADPIVAISAKAGLATVAGQDIQFASGDAISVESGQDTHVASGNQLRLHAGQSIGILAGAVQAGDGAKGKGITLIAGQGPVQMQAQAGTAQVAAKGLVNVQSAHGHIDWAAAKKITLATTGGAQIVIQASGITTQCPGTITVKAAQKSFSGPENDSYQIPGLPSQVCISCLLNAAKYGSPFGLK